MWDKYTYYDFMWQDLNNEIRDKVMTRTFFDIDFFDNIINFTRKSSLGGKRQQKRKFKKVFNNFQLDRTGLDIVRSE